MTDDLTPAAFIQKWKGSNLRERQACHEHFLDLCRLFDHPTPAEADPDGTHFAFDPGVVAAGGERGFADVWKQNFFAWEYKGKKHYDFDAAYRQLLRYHEPLGNPPLLVVCDFDRFVIYPKFTNYVTRPQTIRLEQLAEPEHLARLRAVFHDPETLRPDEDVPTLTRSAVGHLAIIADRLRGRGLDPEAVARYLMKIVFCAFAQDVGLLPKSLFSDVIERSRSDHSAYLPERFTRNLRELFRTMDQGGDFWGYTIRHFDGALFEDHEVFELEEEELKRLAVTARLPWAQIEPAIFGTLFERCIDPAQRAKLGLHYTDPEDIRSVIEPVLMAPLRRLWEEVKRDLHPLAAEYRAARAAGAAPPGRPAIAAPLFPVEPLKARLKDRLLAFIKRLGAVRVLDPSCGSGNFLYLALHALKDLEHEAVKFGLECDLPELQTQRAVHPRQLFGIEINPFAHELASVVVWIGHIQWPMKRGHNYTNEPVLEPLRETIQCRDAILAYDEEGRPREPEWPEADVIIGNPPFLGGKKLRTGNVPWVRAAARRRAAGTADDRGGSGVPPLRAADEPPPPLGGRVGVGGESETPAAESRRGGTPLPPAARKRKRRRKDDDNGREIPAEANGLGDDYVDALFKVWRDHVPPEADYCAYWHEKARAQIEAGKAKRAGLLATQGIRGGANRKVLEEIKKSGDIFEAWSDREWRLDGAAVHISIVCQDDGSEKERRLDGHPVEAIHANLTAGGAADITTAVRLAENAKISFMGTTKQGPFDIDNVTAAKLWAAPNPDGRSNRDVVRPWRNGRDLTGRAVDHYIIDLDALTERDAALYEAPFEYVRRHVKPWRQQRKRAWFREQWWQLYARRPEMYDAIEGRKRFIVTPRVAKHRLFVWLTPNIVPENLLSVFARDDDFFFGVLHSKVHEWWALALGTQLREKKSGFRYTHTTCFETFPFPWPPNADRHTKEQRTHEQAIAAAAAELDRLRNGWLNAPGLDEKELKKRTLTNLYNQRPTWLAHAHAALDRAVLAAYGWDDLAAVVTARDEDRDAAAGAEDAARAEIPRRLLALNRRRAEAVARE